MLVHNLEICLIMNFNFPGTMCSAELWSAKDQQEYKLIMRGNLKKIRVNARNREQMNDVIFRPDALKRKIAVQEKIYRSKDKETDLYDQEKHVKLGIPQDMRPQKTLELLLTDETEEDNTARRGYSYKPFFLYEDEGNEADESRKFMKREVRLAKIDLKKTRDIGRRLLEKICKNSEGHALVNFETNESKRSQNLLNSFSLMSDNRALEKKKTLPINSN
jgi:hypothetical protein